MSFALDGLDGIAARHFNQCSKFGMFMDMIIDRMGTLTFILLLCKAGHDQSWALIFWAVVDAASHWAATLTYSYLLSYFRAAMSQIHHKEKIYRFKVLEVYYKNQYWLMTFLCISAEVPLLF